MSGELILSIYVGLAIVFCGWLAHWGATRAFTRKSDSKEEDQEQSTERLK